MDKIYEKYSKIVYKYFFSLVHNIELSQELTQETFYSAVKNINRFKGECDIKTWLYKIAQNKWKDYLKKTRNKALISYDENWQELETLPNIASFEMDIVDKDDIINLYKQIHKLDEKTREVIYLKLKSNLTFKDIGAVLGKSEEWARVTFHRGKNKLKEEFKNERY